MKEISKSWIKTKTKISLRVRTAKAVHTYRFSGSKEITRTSREFTQLREWCLAAASLPLKRFSPTALAVTPLQKFFIYFSLKNKEKGKKD